MRGISVSIVPVVFLLTTATPVHAEITAEQVRGSINRAVNYLTTQQRRGGGWQDWSSSSSYEGATTSLCTLALLQAGVATDDDRIVRALAELRLAKNVPRKTYSAALHTMCFCAAEPKRDITIIRRNAAWLEQNQITTGPGAGTWSYPGGNKGDNSNTQFALLALHEAERAGVKVGEATWRRALDYWSRTQNNDGSWGYHIGTNGTGSMTCAGISSVIIASGHLTQPDAAVTGRDVRCCQAQEDNPHVQRALRWLAANFSVSRNPNHLGWHIYYLYGLERAGRLSSKRLIGKHDWYREGTELLIRQQDPLEGYFTDMKMAPKERVTWTALALLFLAKGRRPVMMAKLEHKSIAAADDWNNHRNDVANLTRHVEREWEKELTWQTVDSAAAELDDLLQAPVVYLSGSEPLSMDDEEVKRLRDYLNQGGYLFVEACCGDSGRFDRSFRELVHTRLFPEGAYRLQPLDASHPVWRAEVPVVPEKPFGLWGLDYACRTCIFYCPDNIGCYWELAPTTRSEPLPAPVQQQVDAALGIGVNVMAYATNRELKFKYEAPTAPRDGGPADAVQRAKLYIAKLRHAGGWNLAPAAVINLLEALQREAKVRTASGPGDRRDVDIASDKLFDYHLVYMHGRQRFTLSDQQREHLRQFAERGGLLFADAICGSREFDLAFRRAMAATFPDYPLERIPVDHPLFTSKYGGAELELVERREPGQTQPRQVPPELWGVKINDRYAVVYSPYDLSCALESHGPLQCRGYSRRDAERIGINVVLYALSE